MTPPLRVYLDNAATTPLAEEVSLAMFEAMKTTFGNPSSIHAEGRAAKTAVEKSRKKIAVLLGCSPSEIFFTSGGTEADNMAILCAVRDLGVREVISSELEHHAVLHTLQFLAGRGEIRLHMVKNDSAGRIDLLHLKLLLEGISGSTDGIRPSNRTLVSLMHANNEIGTIADLDAIGKICKAHCALFHSDTVQSIGHYRLDLNRLPVDFIACAAHKFHGPKGTGFIYIRRSIQVLPLIHGGAQERNLRGGTENVFAIVGMARALELAYEHLDEHRSYIQGLKNEMLKLLTAGISGLRVNGAENEDESLYTVLNVSMPETVLGDLLLFNLDISGVAASHGSACSSGSEIGSHVLKAIGVSNDRPSLRFSFSRYNTLGDVQYAVERLLSILKKQGLVSLKDEQFI